MNFQGEAKEMLKKEILDRLSEFPEVRKVVIFGSFVNSDNPQDIDIAVFHDSDESYFPLAMKYRLALRTIANKIPLDVIPIPKSPEQGPFIEEIQKGEVLYERKDK